MRRSSHAGRETRWALSIRGVSPEGVVVLGLGVGVLERKSCRGVGRADYLDDWRL